MSDIESEQECSPQSHLKFYKTNTRIFYACSYCGHDPISDGQVEKHFDHLEKTNSHFTYGSCKDERRDNKFYSAFR